GCFRLALSRRYDPRNSAGRAASLLAHRAARRLPAANDRDGALTMGWKLNDLTARTGAPEAAIFGLSGYMFVGQGTQHVLYQGFAGDGEGSGVLHELWWSSEGWHHTNLT